MKREELINLSISEEHIDKIMQLHGKDIEKHKVAVKDSTQKIETLQVQLNEASEKLSGYEPNWRDIVEDAKKHADDTILTINRDNALAKELAACGVRDTLAVKAHIDMQTVAYDENTGTLTGLSEQLTQMRETHSFLFDDYTAPPIFCADTKGVTITRPHVNEQANTAIRALFGRD